MVSKFVMSLNAISSQPYAILILLIGFAMLVACKKWGIDTTIAGGVIGCATTMLQATVSKSHSDNYGTEQETETPSLPKP